MDDRLPAQLSGGQQQRVAVARALAHRPQVLLMDEPFGALDAKIREELRRTIRQIQRELDMTTILVTHDQEEAFALADRIGVMHQGRLLECGKPDDLYTRPATRFVSTFLGAANLLLGYRTPPRRALQLRADRGRRRCRGKSSPCCGRRKWNSAPTSRQVKSNFVGHGQVEEVLFGGAVERLRVRMASDGPVPVAPGRDGSPTGGSLLEVSRTLPEQRDFPVRRRPARRRRRAPHPRAADADFELHRRGGGRSGRAASCAIRRCSRRSAPACRRASRRADRSLRAGAAGHARDRDRARYARRRRSGT